MQNYRFLLNLERENIRGATIKNIAGIKKEKNNIDGDYYAKRYFVKNKFGLNMIGIRSKTSNFNSPFSIELYNGVEFAGVLILSSNNATPENLKKFFSEMSTYRPSKKLFSLKSKIISNDKNIQENRAKGIKQLGGQLFYSLIIAGIMSFSIISVLITKWRHSREEHRAEISAEQNLNKKLFGSQEYDDPAFKVYSEITNGLKGIFDNKLNGLILCGPPGMSKTYIVRRELYFNNLKGRIDYNIEKGAAVELVDVYTLLFRNRNRILILDDFDVPLNNEDVSNLLKAATDSYAKKIISLPRTKLFNFQGMSVSEAPEKFVYNGKVIIITNLLKRQINKALLSRLPAVEILFDIKEVILTIEKMLKYISPEVPMELKKEILDFIKAFYKKHPNMIIDIRRFENLVNIKYYMPEYFDSMIDSVLLP